MAKTTKHKYIVVVAEYDECGSDGLDICNAIPFNKPKAAAKFIVEDYADTMSYDEDTEGEELDLEQVTAKIESLQNQINTLQLQNAVAGVVRYPMSSVYSTGCNPFCGCACGA